MFETGGLIDGRYKILSLIGEGGMAFVYRAMDIKLDRQVAVKVLKPEAAVHDNAVSSFRSEARAAARLSHQNIVTAYDIVDSGDIHYIVMELVEGVTLKNYISQKGQLTSGETITITLQAAEGIKEAHKNGIIHRDIKPQNIIIAKDGRIKITDFGIAAVGENKEKSGDDVLGSVHYIAPEQARTGEADERSDIYSLGISMYEMITGHVPYDAEDTMNILLAHLEEAMVPPSVYNKEIYPALNDIIIKAARKNPDERYQNAEDLISDLERAFREPEGHFVKFFDTVVSSEADGIKPDSELNAGFPEDKAGTGEAAPDETGVGAGKKTGGKAGVFISKVKNRILAVTGSAALLLIIILSLVILKEFGDKKTSMAEQAAGITAEETDAGETTAADYTISIKGEELVPYLIGMDEAEAREALHILGVDMDSSAGDYSDEYPKGAIMNQTPAAGDILTADTPVYVTVSKGSVSSEVLEKLEGLTRDEATNLLGDAGISDITVTEAFSEEIEEGKVISYNADVSGAVTITVSMGSESGYALVPDVTGLDTESAVMLLYEAGLTARRLTTGASQGYDEDIIVSQDVEGGSYVKLGTFVNLTVSQGDNPTVPEGTVLSEDISARYEYSVEEDTYEEESLSSDYYYASIDTVCTLGGGKGPGEGNEVMVGIRLKQVNGGSTEYTVLTQPIPVERGDTIPVIFRNIRGLYGVTEGYIEVYDSATQEIYGSYPVTFGPLS